MSRANVEKAAGAIGRGIEKFLTGNITNPGTGNNNGSGSSAPPATPGQQRQYIIKAGDTLTAIAQRELGNANRWREIVKTPTGGTFTEAQAQQLRVGESVYLPVSYQSGPGTPVKQVPTTNPNQTNFEIGRVSSRVGSVPLNLRSQAQVTSQNRIDTLPVGKEMKILRSVSGATYSTGNGNRNDWYEVEVNGKRGFVAAFFVDKGSSAPPPPQSGFVNSNVGGGPLRLRSSASTSAQILTNLNQGTNLKILGSVTGATYNTGNGNRNDWYEVEVNGKRGFVAAYYVTKGSSAEPQKPQSNEPPLHSNPTESNPLKGFSHPFKGAGTLTQGWKTTFSHKGSSAYAMDFDRYFGAPVYAMRSGKVISVIENFDDNGRNDPSLGNKANLVFIQHDNGYVSRYLHLKKNSVSVQVGDSVSAGQQIAEQGNSGWSTASHLHVAIHKGSGSSVPFEIPGVNPR
jgi:murein DD-endopeptidase MepM/ murein hydrolase activator NlpD